MQDVPINRGSRIIAKARHFEPRAPAFRGELPGQAVRPSDVDSEPCLESTELFIDDPYA